MFRYMCVCVCVYVYMMTSTRVFPEVLICLPFNHLRWLLVGESFIVFSCCECLSVCVYWICAFLNQVRLGVSVSVHQS